MLEAAAPKDMFADDKQEISDDEEKTSKDKKNA